MARVAIVTGGAGETGAAAAFRLAEEGMDIALLDPDETACADTVRRITGLGHRCVVLNTDVTDAASVDAALTEICAVLGDPAVLLNVTGDATPGPLSGLSEHDWYASTGARLRGVFLTSRAVVDPMIKNGWGRILTLAGPGHENATLRAGLAGFTRTIALELKMFGITANALVPAIPGAGSPATDADARSRYSAHVADALPFLAGEAASSVSGQVISVGTD